MIARQQKIALTLTLVAVLLGAAARTLVAGVDFFSHAMHLESGVDCTDCHTGEGNGPPTTMTMGCADCHDEAPPAAPPTITRRHSNIAFDHRRHVDALGCEGCHDATARDGSDRRRPVLARVDCVRCHEENGVEASSTRCDTCHGAGRRRTAPATHVASWRGRHGRAARWQSNEPHGRGCFECHTNGQCRSCHLTHRPRGHSGLWRVRTHGRAAAFDRDRCKTCHETGACVGCHRSTAPLDHRGSWRHLHGLKAQ
ncbi:MAG: cytochrome c3 family protein, partial [Deltaproteobacteria bacterium]|nr:cytochrome c3 family protein [Deltaproteobacteria bacterium]